jgi:hypothetical protein
MTKQEVEKFKDISIRGRFAFGLTCLENLIAYYNLDSEELDSLIGGFWQFTEAEYVDSALPYLVEANPKVILDDYQLYQQGKIAFDQIGLQELQNPAEFKKRYELLKDLPESIKELKDTLESIVSIELYGKVVGYSGKTYQYTLDIIKLMQAFPETLMPQVEDYTFSSFGQSNGWGIRFTKEAIGKTTNR